MYFGNSFAVGVALMGIGVFCCCFGCFVKGVFQLIAGVVVFSCGYKILVHPKRKKSWTEVTVQDVYRIDISLCTQGQPKTEEELSHGA